MQGAGIMLASIGGGILMLLAGVLMAWWGRWDSAWLLWRWGAMWTAMGALPIVAVEYFEARAARRREQASLK